MNSRLTDSPLTEQDFRDVVRLLGEVVAAVGEISAKRRMLMDGLCRLIDATSWVWYMTEADSDKPLSYIELIHGGSGHAGFAHYLEAMNHRTMEHSETAPSWKQGTIGALMTSLSPMKGGGTSAIGVYRNPGLPHFDEREARIAQILLTEIPWLHSKSFPDQEDQTFTRLYPRHRTVLNFLCEGWSRKKIADHLDLSINTIHGYAKCIFQHFDVHSQSELISRITKGDGGDHPLPLKS